ncbi:MAG: hypothetical protein PHF72_06665, partial [Gammaproteobacteria bacterium]|nr:hypothetical protein [Gammaproteobacteria bacterium]
MRAGTHHCRPPAGIPRPPGAGPAIVPFRPFAYKWGMDEPDTPSVTLRFYEELNDFLPAHKDRKSA